MEYAIDGYGSTDIFEEDGVGETSDQSTSVRLVNFGIEFRGPTNPAEAGIDAIEELLAKT